MSVDSVRLRFFSLVGRPGVSEKMLTEFHDTGKKEKNKRKRDSKA